MHQLIPKKDLAGAFSIHLYREGLKLK